MCLPASLALPLSCGVAVRGRMDPLWNSIVVGGVQDGKPFLGTVGMLGVQFSDEHIATGGPPCGLQPGSASPHVEACAGVFQRAVSLELVEPTLDFVPQSKATCACTWNISVMWKDRRCPCMVRHCSGWHWNVVMCAEIALQALGRCWRGRCSGKGTGRT